MSSKPNENLKHNLVYMPIVQIYFASPEFAAYSHFHIAFISFFFLVIFDKNFAKTAFGTFFDSRQNYEIV